MAIYHNRTDIIRRQARDKNGKKILGKEVSTLAKAAYRSGDVLRDERINRTFDYRGRTHEVVRAGILAPDGAPGGIHSNEATDGEGRKEQREMRGRLWNAIERVEKRRDNQLAREFELALPIEMDEEQWAALVRDWCGREIVSKGYIADYAIHRSRSGRNPHAHILCTLRPVDAAAPSGFGLKPDKEGKFYGGGKVGKATKDELENWRETWAAAENRALQAAGIAARVDHRSLKAQGIDRAAGVHLGVAAAAMQRQGLRTGRGGRDMQAKMENRVRPALRGIERTGEVPQVGIGATWWERAQAAIGYAEEEAVFEERSGACAWQEYEQGRREREEEPDLDR